MARFPQNAFLALKALKISRENCITNLFGHRRDGTISTPKFATEKRML